MLQNYWLDVWYVGLLIGQFQSFTHSIMLQLANQHPLQTEEMPPAELVNAGQGIPVKWVRTSTIDEMI
jgi:hypothetical protein